MVQVMRGAYELPEQVVSDNSSQFTSYIQEFTEFMKQNGIKHNIIKSTPYYPSANGLAECFWIETNTSISLVGKFSASLSKFTSLYHQSHLKQVVFEMEAVYRTY